MTTQETIQHINNRLGVEIYDTSFNGLSLNKFTTKQIMKLFIDDLINPETHQATDRLKRFTTQILLELAE